MGEANYNFPRMHLDRPEEAVGVWHSDENTTWDVHPTHPSAWAGVLAPLPT